MSFIISTEVCFKYAGEVSIKLVLDTHRWLVGIKWLTDVSRWDNGYERLVRLLEGNRLPDLFYEQCSLPQCLDLVL